MKSILPRLTILLAIFCPPTMLSHTLTTPGRVFVEVNLGEEIPAATFTVSSTPSELPFEISASSSLFSFSQSSNVTPAVITVEFDQSASQTPGAQTGTIEVSMPELLPDFDLQNTVTVRLVVRTPSDPPSILAGRTELRFSGFAAGPPPAQENLRVTNAGGGILGYSLGLSYADGQPVGWLTASPTEGVISQSSGLHAMTVNTAGLPAGQYNAIVTISGNADNSPQTIDVSLTLTEPALLAPNPFDLDLQTFEGVPPAPLSSFLVENFGGGSVEYLLTPNAPWLKVTPLQVFVSAEDPGEHQASVDATGLTAGSYQTTVTIQPLSAGVAGDEIFVSLTVDDFGQLTAAPSPVSLSGVAGATNAAAGALTVTSDQMGHLAWRARVENDEPWLTVDSSGPVPGTLAIQADASGLGAGVYSTEIVLSAEPLGSVPESVFDDVVRVPVTLNLTASGPPAISLGRTTILFESAAAGAIARRSLSIRSTPGGGELPWAIDGSQLPGWIRPSSYEGTTPSVVELAADPSGLAAGLYQHELKVLGGEAPATVAVAFVVKGSAADVLSLAPRGMTVDATIADSSPQSKSLWATNHGSDAVDWQASVFGEAEVGWLQLPSSGGSIPPGESSSIPLEIRPAGLSPDEYSALVRVQTSDGTALFTSIVLRVDDGSGGPQANVAPQGVFLSSSLADPAVAAADIEIGRAGGARVPFQAAASVPIGSWLTVSPLRGAITGSETTTVGVAADPAGLAAGEHRGEIIIDLANGQTRAIPVLLVVRADQGATGPQQGIPGCSPDGVSALLMGPPPGFEARVGSSVALAVEVRDSCAATIDDAAPSVQFSSGEPSISLAAIGNGRYMGVWTPERTGSQVTASVRLRDALPAEATGVVMASDEPWIARSGIVNGADFSVRQTAAAGSIVSVFGGGLSIGSALAGETPLPRSLANAEVLVDGLPAPLFAAFPGQINVQVPFESAGNSVAEFVVHTAGRYSTPERLGVVESQPGIFELPATIDGPGRAAAINLDGSLNTSANPASSNSFVTVFLTGQGPLTVAVESGAPAPSSPPLAEAALDSVVLLDGEPATSPFVGLTPGFVGLLQANVQLGTYAEKSDVNVTVRVGEYESSPLKISVQP